MTTDEKTETEHQDTPKEHKHHTEEPSSDPEEQPEAEPKKVRADFLGQKTQSFLRWYTSHKKLSIPASVGLFLVVFFAVPFTRYSVLGLFLKQDFPVVIIDSQTGKPVSSARITLKGESVSTDGQGRADFHVPVGAGKLVVSKTYYKSSSRSVVVPVKKPAETLRIQLEAIGRPVPVTVRNNISGNPIAGAVLSAEKTQAKTDEKGQATLVVPADKREIKGTLSSDGYNKTEVTIKVTTQEDPANTFKLTPSGKIYFLSNQSGKIDVVKADLDGQNRQTVVAGTGKEVKGETVLLATRDWRYLALLSKRDGGSDAKLFLINTADDSMTTMDEGTASFELSGWEGHRFIYKVVRYKLQSWEPKKYALKSFNADDKKITTLDQTVAEGSNGYDYKSELMGTVYVVGGKAVYSKYWNGGSYYWYSGLSKQTTLNSIKPDGSAKKVVKTFDTPGGISIIPYEPGSLYVGAEDKFYEYESDNLKSLPDMKPETFYSTEYTTYLASPDGKRTFWSQSRDGKLAFFVGNSEGKDEKRVATLSTEFNVYGWYTDNYLLVSKKGSELFIMPVGGVDKEDQLFKMTDYFKPYYNYAGYGGGYGGL